MLTGLFDGIAWKITAGIAAAGLLAGTAVASGEPTRLIFDTDFQTDVDDAGALGILHALADLGEAEILATIVSAKNPHSVPAVDVVNTWYGRGSIPIGVVNGPGVNLNTKFADGLAEKFPHDITAETAFDAVRLYRELLVEQDDNSITLVTVGYATNLRDLLASRPDDLSPLSGAELVARKVRKWVNMGGNFENRRKADGFPYDMNDTNVNWERDAQAAITAIENWPTEIVFVGREIGHSLRAGEVLGQTPAENPVRVGYEEQFGGVRDHHLADLSTVLYAVRGLGHGDDKYWAQEFGQIEMLDGAKFYWQPGATGPRTESRIVDALTRPDLGLLSLGEIEAVVDGLLMRAPAGPDTTPPEAPADPAAQAHPVLAGRYQLSWSPGSETDTGSWLAGYRVYRGDQLVGQTVGTRFTDLIPAAGDYQYQIAAINASGYESERIGLAITATTSAGSGDGLTGAYFNNVTLDGDAVLTRTDGTIDFAWGTAAPGDDVNTDHFAVRWTGLIEAAHAQGALEYTLSTLSNDGVRLWIDGQPIIDDWTNGPERDNSGTFTFEAGKQYEIRLEYYDNTNTATIRLLWEAEGLPREIVPTRRLYSAVPDPAAAGSAGTLTGLTLVWRHRRK